ncbi:MAG: amidohydrolase [Clostridiales bacterium]|nr:amidohydrolase [Clostridiales bacterium]
MYADIVIRNGKVYSVGLDGREIRGEAVAVSGGKILAAGTDKEIGQFIGDGTKVIDAGNNSVLPGFCDAHVHASFTAGALLPCDLFCITSDNASMPSEKTLRFLSSCVRRFPKAGKRFVRMLVSGAKRASKKDGREAMTKKYTDKLKEYIDENPGLEIIRGIGWNLGYFGYTQDDMPTRHDLDAVCMDKPIVMESFCQHHLWVNSKTLEICGIGRDTPDPKIGGLWRDADGEPTGMLSEFSAENLVRHRLPGYDQTVEQYKEVFRKYQSELANRYGVTMIFDALCSDNAMQAYREMARDGELTIRVAGCYYADPGLPASGFDEFIARKGKDDVSDTYKVNCIKFFMEGSAMAFYFGEPYEYACLLSAGYPDGYRGHPYWTADEMDNYFTKLNGAGYQIHVHAMGDAAVTHTLDGFEQARAKLGKGARNVIAHLMYVQEGDFKRMGDLGVIACVQPTWMSHEPVMYLSYLAMAGAGRRDQFYPYKRFLDNGATVSMGTDFPVTPPPDHFISIETALTRKIPRCTVGYEEYKDMTLGPPRDPCQDAVSLKEAIKSLTVCGAYQNSWEGITGTLEAGKSADIVVLDTDIESAAPEDIHKIKVHYTIFKGDIVYEKPVGQ